MGKKGVISCFNPNDIECKQQMISGKFTSRGGNAYAWLQ